MMGTRADFYIGRGPEAKWIGSIAMDGYPDGHPEPLVSIGTEQVFREKVSEIIAECGHGTTPDMGWPWPWDNSNTTDFSYAFDGGVVWATCFGHGWWRASDGEPEDDANTPKIPDSEWPDMSERKNVTFGPRSGLLILTTGGE